MSHILKVLNYEKFIVICITFSFWIMYDIQLCVSNLINIKETCQDKSREKIFKKSFLFHVTDIHFSTVYNYEILARTENILHEKVFLKCPSIVILLDVLRYFMVWSSLLFLMKCFGLFSKCERNFQKLFILTVKI